MPHHGDIEGNLPQLSARIGVRLEQHIDIRLQEDAYRHLARTEEDLRGCLVLPVKNLDRAGTVLLGDPPSEPHVELRPPLQELLDQAPDVGSDTTWIDAIIVV